MIDQDALGQLVARTMNYIDEQYGDDESAELRRAAIVFEIAYEVDGELDEDGDEVETNAVHVEADLDTTETTGLMYRARLAVEGRAT